MRSRLRNMLAMLAMLALSSLLETPQGVDGTLGDILDRPRGVHPAQQAALAVVADQRGGLVGVDLEPVPDRLLAVVVALEQLPVATVADPVGARRVEVEVPDVPA